MTGDFIARAAEERRAAARNGLRKPIGAGLVGSGQARMPGQIGEGGES